MQNILFVNRDIENLNMNDINHDVVGLLKTDTSPEVIQTLLSNNKTLDDVLKLIDKNEKDAVYIKINDCKISEITNTAPIDIVYYLNNNKIIKLER